MESDYNSDLFKIQKTQKKLIYNFTLHISIHFILQSVVYILMSLFFIISVSQGED